MNVVTREHANTMSLSASLAVAFFIVIASAFLLSQGEQILVHNMQSTPEDTRTQIGESEDIDSKLNWGNLAHKVFGVETVHAAPRRGFEAKMVRISKTKFAMDPGEERTIYVRLKNIGSQAWNQEGDKHVSFYSYDPKYRNSAFRHSAWVSSIQPAKADQVSVAPNEVATFSIKFKAPTTPARYVETFQLAAEDTAWIPGGKITFQIEVKDPSAAPPPKVTSPPKKVASAPIVSSPVDTTPAELLVHHNALRLIQSHKAVKAAGGQEIIFKVGFKNVGDTQWLSREIRDTQTAIASTDATSKFSHNSWVAPGQVMKLSSGVINPGQLEIYSFTFKTPTERGDYTARFQLYVSGSPVDGGEIEIPVTVTADAPLLVGPITFEGQEQLGDEPIIRVGLYKLEGGAVVQSQYDYVVQSGSGNVLGQLPKNTSIILSHTDRGKYTAEAPGITVSQTDSIRLVPKDGNSDAFFQITNREDRPKWNTSLNYNTFRGILEIRYSNKNEKTWLINELPIEQYVAGVAETSNYSQREFQKSLMTAVRTYAYYHQQRGTKHKDRNFHVDAKYDQVYKGHGREMRFDKVVSSVHATRGEMVTYQGEPVITPYYSNSDGRTRDWTEVWGGGEKPWLQSVMAEYDKGKTLWGHGVGMSARDANKRAADQGLNYKELLEYYYRGTEVERFWK